MPPLPLSILLRALLPGLSRPSYAVLGMLACRNGQPPSADAVAAWVGLRSRYQLARLLRRDGLPPLEQLARWTRVLYWLLEGEATGATLRELARRARIDPAVAYRLVRRVTGRRWSEARAAGVASVLREFHNRCRPTRGVTRAVIARAPAWAPAAVRSDSVAGVSRGRGAPGHPHGDLTGRVPVPGTPFDVAFVGCDRACVTRVHAAVVECVQVAPLGVTASIPVGAVPTRVVCNASGTHAYVTNQFDDEVGVIDIASRRQVAGIAVPGNPLGTLLAPDDATLYVTTNLDRLCAVSLLQTRVIASVAIPLACAHLALHPSGRRLYVATWKAGLILEVDATTLHTLRSFPVGGEVQDLAVSADGRTLYEANERGWLDVIDLCTGRGTRRELGAPAFGLAVSPDGAVVYVGLVTAGQISVIDGGTLGVVTTLATGGKPRRIAFAPGGRAALVVNESGWLDLVS